MKRISTPDTSETVEKEGQHEQQPTGNCLAKEYCKKKRSVGRYRK